MLQRRVSSLLWKVHPDGLTALLAAEQLQPCPASRAAPALEALLKMWSLELHQPCWVRTLFSLDPTVTRVFVRNSTLDVLETKQP